MKNDLPPNTQTGGIMWTSDRRSSSTSIIHSLFGPSDPEAPVLVYIEGDDGAEGRQHFVNSLRRELALADAHGVRAGLESGLQVLADALSLRVLGRSIVVARGGERPVVWEVPGLELPTTRTRFWVRDSPPDWLEDLITTPIQHPTDDTRKAA